MLLLRFFLKTTADGEKREREKERERKREREERDIVSQKSEQLFFSCSEKDF